MLIRGLLAMVVVCSLVTGCADEEEAEAWAADEVVGEAQAPLISTWYASSSRSIYARASAFRGTPNVKITTRAVVGGACRTTGPVVMQRLPAGSTSTQICASLGLIRGVVAGGYSACRTANSNTEIPVMYYNFTSATQTQLNYNVFDWNGSRMLDQSGWQPAAGNGCPR